MYHGIFLFSYYCISIFNMCHGHFFEVSYVNTMVNIIHYYAIYQSAIALPSHTIIVPWYTFYMGGLRSLRSYLIIIDYMFSVT